MLAAIEHAGRALTPGKILALAKGKVASLNLSTMHHHVNALHARPGSMQDLAPAGFVVSAHEIALRGLCRRLQPNPGLVMLEHIHAELPASGMALFFLLGMRHGIVAYGFLRLHCGACGHDKLVAFSCKRRGFCPSCGARDKRLMVAAIERGVAYTQAVG